MKENAIIEHIYSQNRDYMFRVAMNIVHNPYDAEDILGDCMVKILLQADYLSLLPQNKKLPYIIRAVRNTSIDHLRRKKAWGSLCPFREEYLPQAVLQTVYDEENCLNHLFLESCLEILSPKQREVAYLLLDNYGYLDIANELGVNISTVRKYWFQAKRRINAYMEDQSAR